MQPWYVRRLRAALVALVIAGFLIRVAWQIRVGFYVQPETWEYDAIARNIVEGRGYAFEFLGTEWHTFATPLYPLTLALLHWAGGGAHSYVLVGLFQAGVSAAAGMLAYVIARQLSGAGAGLLAAATVELHPALVVYAAKVHELTFEAALAAFALVVIISLMRQRDAATGFRGGLVTGLAALTRPTLAAFAGFALIILALRRPRVPLLIAALTLILITASWTIRNAYVLGDVSLSAPYNCVTLWMGNNAVTDGGTLARDGRSVFDAMPAQLRERVVGRPEAEQGRAFCDAGFEFLRADPVASLGWWARKLGYFWWFGPQSGVFYPAGWLDAYRLAYVVELAFVMFGVVTVWRSGWRTGLGLVILQLAVISVAQSFFYVEGRHRLLVEPQLAALAGIGGLSAFDRLATIGRFRH